MVWDCRLHHEAFLAEESAQAEFVPPDDVIFRDFDADPSPEASERRFTEAVAPEAQAVALKVAAKLGRVGHPPDVGSARVEEPVEAALGAGVAHG